MANRITYKPSGILLSSAIGDIDISTDDAYVDVTLTAFGGIVLLSERYYAYGGKVTLYDIGSLIEASMRKGGETVGRFTLAVFKDTPGTSADSWVLEVLYCDRFSVCTDLQKFLEENFLTTLAMRRVAPGTTVSLFLFVEKASQVTAKVTHTFRRIGSDAEFHHSFTVDAGRTSADRQVLQFNFSVSSLVADGAGLALAPLNEIVPVSFTIRIGQRSMSFFVDGTLSDRQLFMFRNCFNVWDCAYLGGVTTAKTDVERSTAILNGSSQFYDQTVSKKHEVESSLLTSDEAEWIDQLFTSYDVLRIEEDGTSEDEPLQLVPILITDSTCEVQDGDEKLNKVKFSWRFCPNRPLVRMSASKGIFSSPYDPSYT